LIWRIASDCFTASGEFAARAAIPLFHLFHPFRLFHPSRPFRLFHRFVLPPPLGMSAIPSCVFAGLDPAIHGASGTMDPRAKPAGDAS
jgi:hypothetical protein